MLPPDLKRTYFALMAVPMRVNAWVYEHFRVPQGPLRVQLGPGQEHYFEGWVNVDGNVVTAKRDVWSDLRGRLPFPDDSVDVFYSHHVIEHLPDPALLPHFREMLRALRPGGGIRVGAPHLGNACKKYVAGDRDWFHEYPDRRESIGGRFTNLMFCRGDHMTALDESYLAEIATNAGYVDIAFCMPTRDTTMPEHIDAQVFSKETESDFEFPHTVILEARKPRTRG